MKRYKQVILVVLVILCIGAVICTVSNERIKFMVMESIETIADRNFKERQLKYPNVKTAVTEKEDHLRELFNSYKLNYPPEEIYIRAFKEEKKLELWARGDNTGKFAMIKDYNFAKLSGVLGPKRREGDLQVPEGFYYIDRFNPSSKFYLSLGLNYPNKSDKILGDKEKPGFDIFIHGKDSSVGCIPIGDENIKEVYLLAVEVKANGQENIPVHIFPKRLTDEALRDLKVKYSGNNSLISLWNNLKEGFDIFEVDHVPPSYTIDSTGKYIFNK